MKDYAKTYTGLAVRRDSGASVEEARFQAAREVSVELFINDRRVASILTTPHLLRELALGFLVCEGAVNRLDDVLSMRVEGSKIMVVLREREELDLWCELRSSGCVGVNWRESTHIQPAPEAIFDAGVLLGSLGHLESSAYHLTRGTHAACLINQRGGCTGKVVDIGRHNAIDKLVGLALEEGVDLSRHALLSTGRQSAGMVLKAVRAGIPVIVTKTAPFDSGIEAADRYNLTLICFAAQDYMLITTHPEKIKI